MVVDKNGSEIKAGDRVTVTGKIIAVSKDITIAIDGNTPSPLVILPATSVEKVGESDTLKAAKRGFNTLHETQGDSK